MLTLNSSSNKMKWNTTLSPWVSTVTDKRPTSTHNSVSRYGHLVGKEREKTSISWRLSVKGKWVLILLVFSLQA